jgi:hypothetical protein
VIRLVLLVVGVGVVVYFALRWRREGREDALARARSAFFLVRPSSPEQGPPSAQMKAVSLGDDLVRLRVPQSWTEEIVAGAYAARASNSRRFRAEARSVARREVTVATLAEEFRESPEGRKGRVDVLPNDRVLMKHVRDGAEETNVGLTYCWSLAAPRPPDGAVVAELSFSVPLGATDAITEDDLALLEREIQAAVVAETPSRSA